MLVALATLCPAGVFAQTYDGFEYRNVGPARGGRVTAVAGTVAARSTFYLGASGGGVWKTTDYGTSWHNVSDGYFETPSVGDIAVAQNDANIIYVGTGSDGLRSNVIAGKGVYKSVDGGDSWQHIGLRETGHIGAVEIDPDNNNVVWVAAIGQAFNANDERGVYKTVDGGTTWERLLFISDTVGFSDVELLPGNAEVVFATAWRAERKPWTIISGGSSEEGGLYKSVNGGATWRKITDGLPEGVIGKIDLAISPADSSIVYALVEAPDEEGGLYKSVDQGETFELVSNESGIRTRPFYYANIDVDPQDPDIVYAMATRYYKTTDGGESWEELRPPHGDNHDMWINPDDPDLFIQGNDGGANVTHNGGVTWSTQFNQPTAELYQVEVDDQYPYWLYAGQQDNGSTVAVPSQAPYRVQHPMAWFIETGGCETGPAVPKPGNHNIVYSNCKGRFGTFDKRTGTERGYYVGAANMYGHNPRDLRYRFQRVSPIHVSPHDPDTVYHASQFVHRTRDDGVTWETISPDLTAFESDKQVISGSPITRDITGEEFYSTIYSLRESPITPGILWAGANDGPVHVTRDGGESWADVTPPRLPEGGRVDSIEPSHHDEASAYLSVLRYQFGDWQPYIYKTEDFGQRWRRLTTGRNGIPDDFPVRVVREDPVRPGLLYAGTEWGMFVSLDDGETWDEFQQNLPVTPITDMKLTRNSLAISTMGRSFWVLDNVATLRQEAFREAGENAVLFEPTNTIRYRQTFRNRDPNAVPQYPTPAVVIDYYLPDELDSAIRLEILDAGGQLVNAFEHDPTADDAEDDGDAAIEDMGTNQTIYLTDASLTGDAGHNRFRWDMTHQGPWHSDADRRHKNGPMAKAGRYSVRLIVDGSPLEQSFDLETDPRVAALGVTDAMIDRQVDFQLATIRTLNEARRLVSELEDEQASLEEREGEVTAAETSRLTAVTDALTALETAEGIYMQPMLVAQLDYLYNMVRHADQAPGAEATDRLQVLTQQFDAIKQQLGQ